MKLADIPEVQTGQFDPLAPVQHTVIPHVIPKGPLVPELQLQPALSPVLHP